MAVLWGLHHHQLKWIVELLVSQPLPVWLTRAGRLERLYDELTQLDLPERPPLRSLRDEDGLYSFENLYDLDTSDIARLIVNSQLPPEARKHLLEVYETELWALVHKDKSCCITA